MRTSRLFTALLVTLVAMAISPAAFSQAAAETGPPTITPGDLRFNPGTTLRYGPAHRAGLLPEHVAEIPRTTARFMEPSPNRPAYPGAVVLAAKNGVIVTHEAMGHAVRYADDEPTELPRDEWVPTRRDTIYDMASITKLFTTTAVVQQVERGHIDLDKPVASYIPEFAAEGKGSIVVRQLLTHTSGLPAWAPLYRDWDSPEERIQAVYAIEPEAPPGTQYKYSDLGLITLGKIVEKVDGRPLDQVIHEDIGRPLGLRDTGFNPPAAKRDRIAATEWMPAVDRGMVRGVVHDENAWSLNGVAGHAGIFSTARDMSIFAQMMLNGGRYGRARILRTESVRAILTEQNAAFPGNGRGLGWQLDQRWLMDALNSPVTAGHTGFTGTSIVIDPISHSFVVLLTNRVHPSRSWASTNPARRDVARNLARATPVRPALGRDAWFGGMANDRDATLTLPVPDAAKRVTFALWYDTETTDAGSLEASVDGESWEPVRLELRAGRHRWASDGTFSGFAARRWAWVSAEVPDGTSRLRWRYRTDPLYLGRGVYVDGVFVWGPRGELLVNGERQAGRFRPDGWAPSRN